MCEGCSTIELDRLFEPAIGVEPITGEALPVVVWVHFAWNSDFEGLLTGAIWVWAGTQTGYV